ncbi:uncharacterized protein [Lolium perenne]|uniref:uncharacterized protein n=1 Tax=Lolium perenne TaxID=4522 RepID=UPI0021F52805|nr:uncharacterized protein LOC127330095 [Lolium perenne]
MEVQHIPAQRVSRLYIHASKVWSSDKRASVAKNIVSSHVFVTKSCSNDASRLTFWLSNTVVLREIISESFDISHQMTPTMTTNSINDGAQCFDGKSMPMLWKNNSNGKQTKHVLHIPDDWKETSTVLAALESIESWIFSRIVETVWWQALTLHIRRRFLDPKG